MTRSDTVYVFQVRGTLQVWQIWLSWTTDVIFGGCCEGALLLHSALMVVSNKLLHVIYGSTKLYSLQLTNTMRCSVLFKLEACLSGVVERT